MQGNLQHLLRTFDENPDIGQLEVTYLATMRSISPSPATPVVGGVEG